MTIKEVRQLSYSKYKQHPLNSWIISIICGLFIAALLLVGVISELLMVIIVPFVVLPFLFACITAHFGLQARDELSGRALFRLFSLYYRPPFSQSFGVIRSFFKALLVEIILNIIVTMILYSVFSQSPTFVESINKFVELFRTNALTTENMQALLDANDGEISNFVNLSNTISFLFGALAFIIFITREAITIYTRLSIQNIPLANNIARATLKVHAKHFNSAFFALNWPLYLLIIIGMIGGVLVSIYGFHNYLIAGSVGLSIGVATATLFLPFYFSNLEAIFDYLSIDINSLSEEYVKDVFKKYGIDIEVKQTVEAEKKNDPADEDRNE